MRHQKKKITLDRATGPRQALIRNLIESLVLYEKIKTTKAKAKALRSRAEPLITLAKHNTLAARRQLISKLYTPEAVKKLMEVLGPRYAERRGGYTRITKIRNRVGDAAEEVIVEFV